MLMKVRKNTATALAALGLLAGAAGVAAVVPDPAPAKTQEVSAWRGPWPPSPCPWGAVWDPVHMSCVYR